jgi:hypothetical protein
MAVSSTFTATGQSASFTPKTDSGKVPAPFNMSLYGTFVGTVALERTFDSGSNWLPITALGTGISFTAPCSEVFEEGEVGVSYRLNCTSYTSGTISYRISQ